VKAAALKALQIDDSLAEAHTVLAIVGMCCECEWSATEYACKRAIKLNPNYAWAHAVWCNFLVIMGRRDEGMGEAQLAMELDLSRQISRKCDSGTAADLSKAEASAERMVGAIGFEPMTSTV
jgi:Tfp pilus assembly protein PilF